MPRHEYTTPKKEPKQWTRNPVECPECEGHGQWKYAIHTQAACGQCGQEGWVEKGSLNERCIHLWREGRKISNCYYEYVCTECGSKKNVDSGD